MPRVVFSKCKPQGVDAWPIASEYRIGFVGYPVFRDGIEKQEIEWRSQPPTEWLVDPGESDWQGTASRPSRRGYRAQASYNRRLARQVDSGSILLVPRVEGGDCYAGIIDGPLHIAPELPWAEDYLELRRSQGLESEPELGHVADVAQVWSVRKWVTLPFPAVPRWISYRLLSRNTVGTIADLKSPGVSAHRVILDMMDSPPDERYAALTRDRPLERVLLDGLSPRSFEHLLVDLLQIQAPPDVFWHHVGGSGDGGVDAIAVDQSGRLKGVLQAKWRYGRRVDLLAERLASRYSDDVRVVVGVLHGEHDVSPTAGEVWDRGVLVNLVERFAPRLPAFAHFGPSR